MSTKKTIKRGLGLAVGVFAGNAIIVPMISGRDVGLGIIVGLIAAALVLVVYAVIAVCQSDKSCETARVCDQVGARLEAPGESPADPSGSRI